jgi:hypothetical protein
MAKAASPVPIDILAALVDQYAPVRIQVDQFRPTSNLADRLWKSIKKHIADRPKDKPTTLIGLKYVIELDACELDNEVIAKESVFATLRKLFGASRFWQLVTFPVTPIFALLGEDDKQLKDLIATTQTGSRKILSVHLIDGPAAAMSLPKAA